MPDPSATDVVELLAKSRAPLLIGVRHHSPACAAAMGALLDAFKPQHVLVELPEELQSWVPWLGAPTATPPLALAASQADGTALAFYPFAEFSPELQALRWATTNEVPVIAFDLPLAHREPRDDVEQRGGLMPHLLATAEAADTEALWDQLVEAHAPGSSPEEVRRAALAFGWAMRSDAPAGRSDLLRERHMRARLEALGVYGKKPPRVAVVVGAFHAAALVAKPMLWTDVGEPRSAEQRTLISSLIPYAFELLDSRSGYPAGIRDPSWQQAAFEALRAGSAAQLDATMVTQIIDLCRRVRARGHVAGTPDAAEVVRVARDLAHLRGLEVPSRREVVEAIQTALGRGEALGFGRVLARAMGEVLIGHRRGQLAPGTPRSGLSLHVDELLTALKLPTRESASREPVDVRLDPSRSDLDRRRTVALERLVACGVPFATRSENLAVGGLETLTVGWRLEWTPTTAAMIELAGMRGATLAQAAEGTLRAAERQLSGEERLDAGARLTLLERASRAGLPSLVGEWVQALETGVLPTATLPQLLGAHALMERLERGHFVGLPALADASPPDAPGAVSGFVVPARPTRADFLAAAIASLEGLVGSTAIDDVVALHDLLEVFLREGSSALGDSRLIEFIDRLAAQGSPLMQGAGLGAQLALTRVTREVASEWVGSWVDAAADQSTRRNLSERLRGLLVVSAPRLEAEIALLDGVSSRVAALSESDFLSRLPSLRAGFDALSPASRQRLLEALRDRHPSLELTPRATLEFDESPTALGQYAAADGAAHATLQAFGWHELEAQLVVPKLVARGFSAPPPFTTSSSAMPLGVRWRLILGRERDRLPPQSARLNRALDELYGRGRGEGSREEAGAGGGTEAAFPTTREWSDELEALFGTDVREDVLGRATVAGRPTAAEQLDPEKIVPSVELLEQVLSLKGGLAEAGLSRLRRLIARIVDDLVKALATRVQPALTGLATPRASRKKSDRLDLRSTVRSNLHTAYGSDEGWRLRPERLRFLARAKRSLDWHVVLVVDVSGSMEPSTIYSAMMAAILSRLPAVRVSFLAFSTEVIDLSDKVDDPLALLLEVKVGGGTHLAKALRYARSLATVPSRTLVVTVSDFEEGFSVESLVGEVRELVGSGVKALGLAALDDAGKPRFAKGIAESIVAAGMPVAALTPLELARWVAEQMK